MSMRNRKTAKAYLISEPQTVRLCLEADPCVRIVLLQRWICTFE